MSFRKLISRFELQQNTMLNNKIGSKDSDDGLSECNMDGHFCLHS